MPPTISWTRVTRSLLTALVFLCWAGSPSLGQEYTIGPRDVLGITVWGQADLSRDYGVDPDGFMRITDRAKDVIKSGGEWISSVALENRLMGHDSVAEAAVIAMPDEQWSERPLACVVLRDGNPLDVDELRRHLAEAVAGYWQSATSVTPLGVRVATDLPAEIGGGPHDLAAADPVDVRHAPLQRHRMAALIAHHAFGHPGRT